MVNSCDSVGARSRVSGSAIFAGSSRVTGQCDRPGFVAFAHVLLLLLGRHLLDFVYSVCLLLYSELVNVVVLFTRPDSNNQLASGC